MRWFLIDANGTIARSEVAENVAQARFRLAPIPKGWWVVSAVDYDNGYAQATIPVTPTRTRSDNAVLGLRRMRKERPEVEAARREKIAKYQQDRAKRRRQRWKEAARQANILRGIERRRAKRQQQEGTC